MDQRDEMIAKLSAENRKLVWELDRVRFDLRAYKAKFGQLNSADGLAEALDRVERRNLKTKKTSAKWHPPSEY